MTADEWVRYFGSPDGLQLNDGRLAWSCGCDEKVAPSVLLDLVGSGPVAAERVRTKAREQFGEDAAKIEAAVRDWASEKLASEGPVPVKSDEPTVAEARAR